MSLMTQVRTDYILVYIYCEPCKIRFIREIRVPF